MRCVYHPNTIAFLSQNSLKWNKHRMYEIHWVSHNIPNLLWVVYIAQINNPLSVKESLVLTKCNFFPFLGGQYEYVDQIHTKWLILWIPYLLLVLPFFEMVL